MNVIMQIDPKGSFIARPSTVGATDEEIKAMQAGHLSVDRAKHIAENTNAAMISLAYAEPAGRC